jgi:2-amino-4-hydroxy-6-hydroxymethyldihydropteridine diphosphokinase
MILIALGSNLPTSAGGPLDTCRAALRELTAQGVRVRAHSPWYESAPVPASDQPWFVNGVARVDTTLTAPELLALLHAIETRFGRARSVANAARTLDLDLLAYGETILRAGPLRLPHPRLHERAFVLLPLRDVAPDWRHPDLGLTPAALLAALGQGLENQAMRPIPGGS